jgi:hypothetical protein
MAHHKAAAEVQAREMIEGEFCTANSAIGAGCKKNLSEWIAKDSGA